jgi:hypothetical protein
MQEAVLVERAVTVTCRVHDGDVEWWLTVESGRVPMCVSPTLCGCGGHESAVLSRAQRRGYVLLKVSASFWLRKLQWSEVIVGKLSAETLRVVRQRLAVLAAHVRSSPVLEAGDSGEQCLKRHVALAGSLSSWLDGGAFSGSFPCACVLGHVCTSCRAVPESERRFVEQGCYDGMFPYGDDHWWTGVTDGAGELRGEKPWMMCFHERQGKPVSGVQGTGI